MEPMLTRDGHPSPEKVAGRRRPSRQRPMEIQGVSGPMSPEDNDLQCQASRDEMTLNLKVAHNF